MCSSLVPSIAEQMKQSKGRGMVAVSALVEQGVLKLRGIGMEVTHPSSMLEPQG